MYITHSNPSLRVQAKETVITPQFAVIVHRCEPKGQTFLTQHRIDQDPQSGAIQFGEGLPVNERGHSELIEYLSNERQSQRVELLPENVLSQGPDHLCWYVPGQRRAMHFSLSGSNNRVLMVPWPTLVFFASRGSGLKVCGLNTDQRPGADTPIFHAPLMNLYDDGDLCFGSVARPSDFTVAAQPAWEAAIFDSYFTHINHDQTLHPAYSNEDDESISDSRLYRFWRDLGKDATSTFPVEALAPMDMTLSDWLED